MSIYLSIYSTAKSQKIFSILVFLCAFAPLREDKSIYKVFFNSRTNKLAKKQPSRRTANYRC